MLLIGVGSFAALMAIVVAIVFQATSGLTKVADSFFEALKKGDTDQALKYFSEQALNQSSGENLDNFRADNLLASLKSLRWSNRSISIPDRGELTGTINLENGKDIPLTILFVKDGEDWRIYSIKKEAAGILDTINEKELPSEKSLIRLSRKTTSRFVNAIKTNDFSSFYGAISYAFRIEKSVEDLSKGLKQFRHIYETQPASHQYFESLTNMQPIFTNKPSINQSSFLVVSGKYNTNPEFTFTYNYVFEGLGWKLVGLKANF